MAFYLEGVNGFIEVKSANGIKFDQFMGRITGQNKTKFNLHRSQKYITSDGEEVLFKVFSRKGQWNTELPDNEAYRIYGTHMLVKNDWMRIYNPDRSHFVDFDFPTP